MGLFSSSKASSKSSSADNRSMASDLAIAAGGNTGSISRDVFGDHIVSGPSFPWKPVLVGGTVIFILWRIPQTRKAMSEILGLKA